MMDNHLTTEECRRRARVRGLIGSAVVSVVIAIVIWVAF